jgi:hypothetical protein
MKNIVGVFVNYIIQDFKNIAIAVTAQQNMLIGKFILYIVIQGVHKSISDVDLTYAVIKRRGTELKGNIHISSIPHFRPFGKSLTGKPRPPFHYFIRVIDEYFNLW